MATPDAAPGPLAAWVMAVTVLCVRWVTLVKIIEWAWFHILWLATRTFASLNFVDMVTCCGTGQWPLLLLYEPHVCLVKFETLGFAVCPSDMLKHDLLRSLRLLSRVTTCCPCCSFRCRRTVWLKSGFSVISLGPISLCSSPTPTLHLTKCGSRHVVFYLLLRQLNPSKSNQRFFTLCWGV